MWTIAQSVCCLPRKQLMHTAMANQRIQPAQMCRPVFLFPTWLVQGVYVSGELLDVFGRIGGFNFYWAFVSARLAGLAAGGSQ